MKAQLIEGVALSVLVPRVSPLSRAAIEGVAESFVRRVCPDALVGKRCLPVEEIVEFQLAELFGVEFHVNELPAGVEGRFEGNTLTLSTEVYSQLQEGVPRARFTVAHEIGHCALHRNILNRMNALAQHAQVALYRRETVESFRDPEWQANVFAGSALMPISAVINIAESLPTKFRRLLPDRVASKMRVSAEAAAIRVRSLIERRLVFN